VRPEQLDELARGAGGVTDGVQRPRRHQSGTMLPLKRPPVQWSEVRRLSDSPNVGHPVQRKTDWRHSWLTCGRARPDRPVEVPPQCVRLGEQLEQLSQEPSWRTSGRNAITLAKEPALRVVLMLLGMGTKISEHQAAGPLTFHVLSGSVFFRAPACSPLAVHSRTGKR
jgi:hypothetical protein